QALVGLYDLREREDAVDIGAEHSVGQQWHNLGGEGAGHSDFLIERAGAQNGPTELQALAHDVARVELVAAAGDGAHQEQTSLMGHQLLAGFDVGAADEIEHHVDALASGPFGGGGLKFIEVVAHGEAGLEPQRFCLLDLLSGARGAEGNSLDGANELHGSQSYAAAYGVD